MYPLPLLHSALPLVQLLRRVLLLEGAPRTVAVTISEVLVPSFNVRHPDYRSLQDFGPVPFDIRLHLADLRTRSAALPPVADALDRTISDDLSSRLAYDANADPTAMLPTRALEDAFIRHELGLERYIEEASGFHRVFSKLLAGLLHLRRG
jgi:hypothetical protein